MRHNKPVIIEQTVNGVPVGFKVGWWFRPHRYHYGDGGRIFRNIRADSIFHTLDDAQAFRDIIERTRSESAVENTQVD